MANKTSAAIKSVIGGWFNKSEKDVKTLMAERRERETTLMEKLKTMLSDIQYSNNIKLPKEKILEYKIQNRIARMLKVLETELIAQVNTEELDKLVISFADSLKMALEKNLPNMAYWSSVALHKAVESLRVETPDLYAKDTALEEALYKQKLQYAESLSNIISLSKDQDRLEKEIATQTEEINRKQTEYDNRKKAYDLLSKTTEGKNLLSDMNARLATGSPLNEAQKAVRENEKRMTTLRDLIVADYGALEGNDNLLTVKLNEIEDSRAQLLKEPDIQDEKLVAKVKEANRIFREQLQAQMDRAVEAVTAHNEHITAMQQLLNHPLIKMQNAKISEALEAMEAERLEQQMAALEARRELNRKIKNSLMLKQHEQEILKELENEIQTEDEPETDVDTDVDVDTEPEVEVETDVEYDL